MNQEYLVHYGVMGMKWGVRKKEPVSGNGQLSRRQQKKLQKQKIKQAKKANRKQYYDAKVKALHKYVNDTDEYERKSGELREKYQKSIENNEKEARRVRDAYAQSYGENSYQTKAAMKAFDVQKNYSNAINKEKYQKMQAALDTKYSDTLNKARQDWSKARSEAKQIYKSNKSEILKGNTDVVNLGKSVLDKKKKAA